MRRALGCLGLVSLLAGCGPSFDERHLDGLDLSGAVISEFRNRYGMEEERTPLYILGIEVFHRLRFRLRHEDATRFTAAPSGPLFVDEGSSHNAIRVWLPLPKAPRSYQDCLNKWGEPKRRVIIPPGGQDTSLPMNLVGMNFAEFEMRDTEVGVFYDGEQNRIAMITYAPIFREPGASPTPGH